MPANDIIKELKKLKDDKQKEKLQRFFKTGKGEYGEGDEFLGAKVPEQRKIAERHKDLPLREVQRLLYPKIHECRLTGLMILVERYKKAEPEEKRKIVEMYLGNTRNINNWDLVDHSAPKILGEWLLEKKEERKILYDLAKSKDVWERRIAMLACQALIKQKEYKDALKIADVLADDEHDLIHKAVGWMLREIGNRDRAVEERWLKKHYKTMPRTMLRYAIEKFDAEKKKKYLQKRQ